MNVRWIKSPRVSTYHLSHVRPKRQSPEPAAAALAGAIAGLDAALAQRGIPRDAFFDHLVPLAARLDSRDQLARSVLGKTMPAAAVDAAAGSVCRALEALDRAAAPRAAELARQLELREHPLCEQWEARGPGLLTELARLSDPQLLADAADVLLVEPSSGGGGRAYPAANAVALEAVLAHPFPELPETLRLGWLLAQLQADLPVVQGELPRDRAMQLFELALIPAVLAAGSEVELCRPGLQTLEAALAAWPARWHAGPIDPHLLDDWWSTYQRSRPRFCIALAALDHLLP